MKWSYHLASTAISPRVMQVKHQFWPRGITIRPSECISFSSSNQKWRALSVTYTSLKQKRPHATNRSPKRHRTSLKRKPYSPDKPTSKFKIKTRLNPINSSHTSNRLELWTLHLKFASTAYTTEWWAEMFISSSWGTITNKDCVNSTKSVTSSQTAYQPSRTKAYLAMTAQD